MAISQERSKRKNTGGKYHSLKGKRKRTLGNAHLEVTIGATKRKTVKGMGSTTRVRAMLLKEANVLDPKTKKYSKSEIVTVKANKANQHYVRRNTITKGAIIETKLGLAKVLNRPGQEGHVNAVLVEK
ncbi:MAG: 30S ribosomal protein S8e [archaeon]